MGKPRKEGALDLTPMRCSRPTTCPHGPGFQWHLTRVWDGRAWIVVNDRHLDCLCGAEAVRQENPTFSGM